MVAVATKSTPRAAVAGLLLSALASCAGSPEVPDARFERARAAIELAEQNGAVELSYRSLNSAREHFEAARHAAANGDSKLAGRLADKAQVDAELAAARASNRKAEEALYELLESIESLQNEAASIPARGRG